MRPSVDVTSRSGVAPTNERPPRVMQNRVVPSSPARPASTRERSSTDDDETTWVMRDKTILSSAPSSMTPRARVTMRMNSSGLSRAMARGGMGDGGRGARTLANEANDLLRFALELVRRRELLRAHHDLDARLPLGSDEREARHDEARVTEAAPEIVAAHREGEASEEARPRRAERVQLAEDIVRASFGVIPTVGSGAFEESSDSDADHDLTFAVPARSRIPNDQRIGAESEAIEARRARDLPSERNQALGLHRQSLSPGGLDEPVHAQSSTNERRPTKM